MRRVFDLSLLILAIVCLWPAGQLRAMPLHPRVQEGMERTGAIEAFARELKELAKEGYDRPAAMVRELTLRNGMKVAVLLVDFPDNVASGGFPRSHYEDLLFSVGTYPTGSMRDYYLENSLGSFDLTGQVSGWHRMNQTYDYYVAGRRGTRGAYPRNARGLVEDAVRLADALDPGLNWREFDNDGPDGIPGSGDDDGTVDGLIVVHAGPGFEETGNEDDIHSHFWNVVDSGLVVDGVQVFQYMTCPEDGRVGVFAHEFGHNLGLPDLYEVDGGPSSVVGVWSLMAFGAWLSPDGTPFGAAAGTRPSHLDAWSKVATGLAVPILLADNVADYQLRPVTEASDIVRLWTNGGDSNEYFLIENRAPRGFDEGLPLPSPDVGGLLIWHVDEDLATNDDTSHPRVALEQADGFRDIEAARNHGDEGDPFYLGGLFGVGSRTPSTDYAGKQTQVRVDNIRILADAVLSANLAVENAPAPRRARLTLIDDMGNGDGGLDATETARVEVEITNIGLAASGLSVGLESGDPRIAVSSEQILVGDLAANATALLPGTFNVSAGDLPADPYPFELTLHYRAAGFESTEKVLLVAGDVVGFRSSVEEELEDWRHSVGRPGYRDDWHVAAGMGRNGSQGWRCAPPGADEYADLTDARLETPVFAIGGEEVRLVFWHTIDAEVEFGNRAWDGGYVAISLDGGPFTQIEPVGEYFYEIIRNSVSPIAERRVFSGTSDTFERVEFDLSGMEGAARIRFHFGSDGSVTRSGWVVDDVTVASTDDPYGVTFLTPSVDAEGHVIVSFDVDEFFPEQHPYAGQGFVIYRQDISPEFPIGKLAGSALADVPSGFEPLHTVPLPPDTETFIDTDVRPAEVYAYLVEDLRTAGEASRLYGPRRLFVPGAAPQPRVLRTNPNPFQPVAGAATTTIQFLVPAGSGAGGAGQVAVRLGVYDALGRLTRMLIDGPLAPGKNEAEWDGYTALGHAAPSGVYFIGLEAGGKEDGLRFVLVR